MPYPTGASSRASTLSRGTSRTPAASIAAAAGTSAVKYAASISCCAAVNEVPRAAPMPSEQNLSISRCVANPVSTVCGPPGSPASGSSPVSSLLTTA